MQQVWRKPTANTQKLCDSETVKQINKMAASASGNIQSLSFGHIYKTKFWAFVKPINSSSSGAYIHFRTEQKNKVNQARAASIRDVAVQNHSKYIHISRGSFHRLFRCRSRDHSPEQLVQAFTTVTKESQTMSDNRSDKPCGSQKCFNFEHGNFEVEFLTAHRQDPDLHTAKLQINILYFRKSPNKAMITSDPAALSIPVQAPRFVVVIFSTPF